MSDDESRKRKRALSDSESSDSGESEVEEEAQGDTYLETVNRKVLDFDFDKVCSVTLSNSNVYACLVCGKYFQGRGKASQAYLHSVDGDHHVYISLETLRVYVLPEGYEVKSHLLDDIKHVIDPRYTREYVRSLDSPVKEKQLTSHDLFKQPYRPGFVGLNNIRSNDYANAVIQAIAHVRPIRDLCLLADASSKDQKSALFNRTSLLVRRLYNPKAFKGHVSPHELLQLVSTMSKKRFTMTERSDAFAFLVWYINQLHLSLGGTRKPQSSPAHKAFQGHIKAETYSAEGDLESSATVPFLTLSVDLPAVPLFKDETKIPEVALTKLLRKFDGTSVTFEKNVAKKYRLQSPLPPYLIVNIKRGHIPKSDHERAKEGTDEWNPTVVNFIDTNLNMSSYVDDDMESIYDLVANIVYENSKYKVQLKDKQRNAWYLIEDLLVTDIPRERLFLHQSCIQIWEKRP
ncbi:pre-mRNA-splicing factor Sad1p [Trichomonascus vanleenenianus]|uniref:mRNA splicing protein SAD1 n=1 Tax=Trichomonascus vanleenenianus TaxID=2268995 RepID=UPI003ECB91C4